MDEIVKVTSGQSSAHGCHREVFIFGDLVIKRDKSSTGFSNLSEMEAYNNFVAGEHGADGSTYNIKVPSMAMIGEYIVADRVQFPHLAVYNEETGATPCEHEEEYYLCGECTKIINDIEMICEREYDIYDMHSENFMWDADTRTAWIIDIAA